MQERPTVVVGVDGSAESSAALKYAMEEAARRGTAVEVVSVFLPPQYWPEAYGLAAPPTPYEVKTDLHVVARRMVDAVVEDEPSLSLVPVELHELEGKPAEVLIERAWGADRLVVGHRGRGGFASTLLGSVGLKCVLHADCPVTIFRSAPQPQAVTEPDAQTRAAPVEGSTDGLRIADRVVAPMY
jgi:nucleotide-binding universal stress UspA family protein